MDKHTMMFEVSHGAAGLSSRLSGLTPDVAVSEIEDAIRACLRWIEVAQDAAFVIQTGLYGPPMAA